MSHHTADDDDLSEKSKKESHFVFCICISVFLYFCCIWDQPGLGLDCLTTRLMIISVRKQERGLWQPFLNNFFSSSKSHHTTDDNLSEEGKKEGHGNKRGNVGHP